jgi:hypothetical protein
MSPIARSDRADPLTPCVVMTPSRREQSFVARGLVMHWPSVPASANPLREGQRFVRPSRKDAGCHLVLSGGTDGSNPASSSGESAANSAIGSACGVDNHDPLTRDRGFESTSLQRGVCEPSVPRSGICAQVTFGRSHGRCPNSTRTAPSQASWPCSLNGRRSRFPPHAGVAHARPGGGRRGRALPP